MMNATALLEQVRASSGETQEDLARRAGTSRPTLSAYEHGRKSPTVAPLLVDLWDDLVLPRAVRSAWAPG